MHRTGASAGIVLALALAGCVRRQLVITSEPSGAVVHVNDVEVGTTPVSVDFTYYGTYDVLLEKEGCEPLRTRKAAVAPIYEWPPFDLVANAIPASIDHKVRWHFTLEPSLESGGKPAMLERGLVERANLLKDRIDPR